MPGAFTDGTARLVQPGPVQYDENNVPTSVTDVWGVTLARGTRPAIGSISGLPAAGSRHPTYANLLRGAVTIRNAVEQAGSLVWFVDVAYSPKSESTTVSNPNPDPEEPGVESVVRIVAREWPIYETQTELVADAITGDPVLNAAGELYDRAPAITRRYVGARVKRREQNFPALALSLDGTVNKQPFRVLGVLFPSRTARLEIEIEDTLAVGSDGRYIVTYNFVPAHNVYGTEQGEPLDAGWDVPLLECGYSYLNADGDLVRATVPADSGNSDPVPSSLPVKLAADGKLLADGDPPVVTVWAAYEDDDGEWTNLALPTTPTEYDEPEPEA